MLFASATLPAIEVMSRATSSTSHSRSPIPPVVVVVVVVVVAVAPLMDEHIRKHSHGSPRGLRGEDSMVAEQARPLPGDATTLVADSAVCAKQGRRYHVCC